MNALPFSTLSAARILAATALLIVPATGCGGGASSPLETDPTSRTTQPPAARPIEGEGPGVYHTLQHGQTLYALSRAYEVPAGKVTTAGKGRGYGKMVVIDHGNGLTTLYGHASKLLVRKGEKVRTGEPIAQVGRTGNARGTHLHFEVRQGGKSINPMPLLRGDSARPAKNRGDGD